MILLWVILRRDCCRFLVQPFFGATISPRCFALLFFCFTTSSSSSSKSRAIQRACFLFKSIFDYTWFQYNFEGYCSIFLHVDEKFYIYGATDKIYCRKTVAFFLLRVVEKCRSWPLSFVYVFLAVINSSLIYQKVGM